MSVRSFRKKSGSHFWSFFFSLPIPSIAMFNFHFVNRLFTSFPLPKWDPQSTLAPACPVEGIYPQTLNINFYFHCPEAWDPIGFHKFTISFQKLFRYSVFWLNSEGSLSSCFPFGGDPIIPRIKGTTLGEKSAARAKARFWNVTGDAVLKFLGRLTLGWQFFLLPS